jgi:Tol biopolymer transport system component
VNGCQVVTVTAVTFHRIARWAAVIIGAGTLLAAQAALSAGSAARPRHYLIVAVVKPKYKSIVEVVDTRGRQERLVQAPQLTLPSAEWSPDRSMLAWTTGRGIMVERGNGGERRLVFSQPGVRCLGLCVPLTFAWSPDSRRLLVGGAGRRTNRLLTISLNGGRTTDVVRPHADTEYQVIGWAPNGRQIAYQRTSGTYGNDVELIVARPDGTHRRTLFTLQEPIHDSFEGAWSPDSRSIAFSTPNRAPHDPTLAIVNVATGAVHRLPGGWGSQRPAWSSDSKRLAVALGSRTVTMTTAGGRIHSLLELTGASIAWSPRDQITIAGPDAQPWKVFASRNGIAAAKLLFLLPRNVAVVDIDPQ